MGFGSIWHWLIVLLILSVLIGPFLLANKVRTLARKPLAIRYAAAFVFSIVIGAASTVLPTPLDLAGPLLVGLIVGPLMMVWSIYRTQDIGWSRWANLILIVPYVQFAWIILLLFKPGKMPFNLEKA